MMVTILHGDNIVASYNYLLSLKKNFKGEVKEVESKSLTPKQLIELAEQNSLFNSSNLIVITGLPQTPIQEAATILSSDVVIFVDKKITPPKIKAKILEFRDTRAASNFKLADSFAAKDLKGCLLELDNLLKDKVPAELIIGILGRQIRLLIAVKENDFEGINPYVVSKLKSSQGKWQIGALVKSLESLLQVDHKIKTGRMEPKLALLNFFLENLNESI